jgi:hypothetical protein
VGSNLEEKTAVRKNLPERIEVVFGASCLWGDIGFSLGVSAVDVRPQAWLDNRPIPASHRNNPGTANERQWNALPHYLGG